MFQAAMTDEQRREMGAHYTKEANILKVINPLFMNDLNAEFELVKTNTKKLQAFHDKLASRDRQASRNVDYVANS